MISESIFKSWYEIWWFCKKVDSADQSFLPVPTLASRSTSGINLVLYPY
jgi:hypothetical protein